MNCSGKLSPDEIRQNHIFVPGSSKRDLRSEGAKAHAQPRSSRRSLNLDLVRVGDFGENICFGF